MKIKPVQPLDSKNWPKDLFDIRAFLIDPLNIHKLMAHHPELLTAWMPLRNHVVGNSSLSSRHRELIILRTAFHCKADYEWQHHIERGKAVGLTELDIERVKKGPDAQGWQAGESTLIKAVDDCNMQNQISDPVLSDLQHYLTLKQQLDLTVTVGIYITLASLIKTYDLPMEDEGKDGQESSNQAKL